MSTLHWDSMPRYLESKEPRQMEPQQLFRKILVLKNMDSRVCNFARSLLAEWICNLRVGQHLTGKNRETLKR